MARTRLQDNTGRWMDSILRSRGLTQAAAARQLRKPERTVNYQVKHAQRMTLESLRDFIALCDMTDAEIIKVVRG